VAALVGGNELGRRNDGPLGKSDRALAFGFVAVLAATGADAVILPALRGDYVITPAIVRGDEKVEFVGRRPGYGRTEQIVAEEIDEGF